MRRSKRYKDEKFTNNLKLFNQTDDERINKFIDCCTIVEPSAPPDDNNDTLSEYTPLLEDFTERFINRSQGPIFIGPNNQQSSSSSSIVTSNNLQQQQQQQQSITVIQPPQSVPPELLLIHYQQSPFNPNIVPSDISSISSSYSFNSDNNDIINHNNQSNDSNYSSSPNSEWSCLEKFRLHFCQTLWYLSLTILTLSLIFYNFGSTFSPSIYSSLVIKSKRTNATHPRRMVAFDFLALTTFQITMAIIASIGSLIILYSASRVIHRLRRRVHLRNLKQMSNNLQRQPLRNPTIKLLYESESTTTIMTYEMIIYETLGVTMSKIFSSIMLIHQFCLCSLYVHLIYDYFDIFISSTISILSNEWIEYLDNGNQWYLNHLVIGSIWLTFIIIVIVLLSTTTFVWSQNRYYQWRTFEYTKLFLLRLMKIFSTIVGLSTMIILLFVGIDIYQHQNIKFNNFDTIKLNNNKDYIYLNDLYKSLFGAIPLLLMPFHLNELLIMLLCSYYDNDYYRDRLRIFNSNDDENNSILSNNYQTIDSDNNQSNYLMMKIDNTGDPLLYLTSIQSMKRSIKYSFFFRSYSTLRNWFLMILLITILFQSIMNLLYFHDDDDNKTDTTDDKIIELNFLAKYLINENRSSYIMMATIALILNVTIIYLLMLFRAKLSQDWLFSSNNDRRKQSTTTTTRFMFLTPYIVWNCFILINGIIIEYVSKILQLQLWLLGLTTITILLLYPSLLLIYFSCQTLRRCTTIINPASLNDQQQQQNEHQQQQSPQQSIYRPLHWPWLFLFIGLFLFSTTITYLIFWIYGYWYDEKDFGFFQHIEHHYHQLL